MVTRNGNTKVLTYKPLTGGGWIHPARRLAIYICDGFLCLYCGTDLRNFNRLSVTLDHLVPRCLGGSDDARNLVTACRRCNCSRQDKSWKTFAPGGAVARIRFQVRQPVNIDLAKAIITGSAGAPRLEGRR